MNARRTAVQAGLMALWVATALSTPSPAQPEAGAPIIATDHGRVRGATVDGVEAFKGIPYAAPPVGDLRWRPPQPAVAWSGLRPATAFGNICPQKSGIDSARVANEDCLFLNVERPIGSSPNSKLPVFVFIHGGGFTGGHGSNEDPEKIVRETGVVAVTLNYRLGVLGFLALPSLTAEGGANGSGNYGFQDQQAALRWVQANISNFGGDPSRVTIAGESAGGMSVCGHLVAPGSRGLFSQAILQSASCNTQSQVQAEEAGTLLANSMLCPEMATAAACLRSKSASDLLDSRGTGSGFVRGTTTFPNDTRAAIAAGNFAQVPIVIGWTRDEGRSFQRINTGWSKERYIAQVRSQWGSNTDAILTQYAWPASANASTAAYLLSDIQTDARCAHRSLSHDIAKATRTFGYEWDPPETATAWYPIPGFNWGAGHATELPYLFPKRNGGANAAVFSADERQLSRDLIQYWGAFVKTGQPNAKGLAKWPEHGGAGSLMSLRIGGASTVISDADYRTEHRCAFWESLPSQPGA